MTDDKLNTTAPAMASESHDTAKITVESGKEESTTTTSDVVTSGDNAENHKPNETKSCDDPVVVTPTPAETSKKDQQSGKKVISRRQRRNRKKGAWKKLDVDISFNKDTATNSTPTTTSTTSTSSRRKKSTGDKKNTTTSSSTSSQPPSSQSKQQQPHRKKQSQQHNNDSSSSLNWRERSSKKKNKQQQQQQHQHSSSQPWFPSITEEQVSSMKPEAMRQVEYFFTSDELSRNTFLRWNMDTEGYIPAAIVFNFPSVVRYGLPYYDLLDAVSSSEMLEVDQANETIRIKGNFKQWLYPNQEGGFGCPRWIKQVAEALPDDDVKREGGEGANTTKLGNDGGGSSATPDLVHCTDSDSEHTEVGCS